MAKTSKRIAVKTHTPVKTAKRAVGRPRQKPEDSKKRAQILQMAGKMFVKQGFGNVSMDALAAAVPVSKPTLYSHFKDKGALFRAVMEDRCGGLFNALENSIRDNGNLEETLTSIAHRFLDLILSPEALSMHRILAAESQKFPELGQLFYESGPKKVRATVAGYLKSQNDAGRLKIENPEDAASLFLGMVKNTPHMQCLLGLRKSIPQSEKDELVRYAVSVFIKGNRR